MARRTATLLLLGAALVLAPLAPAAPRAGGTFRVAEPARYVTSIDAALIGLGGDIPWVSVACASLMHTQDEPLPAGFRIAPELAVAPPRISKDGKTYTFTIRKDARFNTGAPVTAADVAYTINRLLSPALKSTNNGDFRPIAGAQAVLDGKAGTASGLVASGQTLTIRLTHPVGGFVEGAASELCVLPAGTPIGLEAPVPSAAPYYVSDYVPSQRLVLERNTHYAGPRPQHVDRIVFDLTVDNKQAIDDALNGKADYAWVPTDHYARRAPELARRFGVNGSRFFVEPADTLRMFVLNTSRPLLHDNVPLRQAINFAVERTELVRVSGGRYAGTPTDQFLQPIMPGYRDAQIYPPGKPDLAKARSLAKGHTRSAKLILYMPDVTDASAMAQIVKRDLGHIGLQVSIRRLPTQLYYRKLGTPGEPFDMAYAGWLHNGRDGGRLLDELFDGRLIGTPANEDYSNFDSPLWNRALRRDSRLTGKARDRAFGQLDVRLARDAAPAVAFRIDNTLTLVSARTGCVITNPSLDLAAVCLK